MSDEKPMGQVIQFDEARIRDHLGEMVRGTVEETLNAMLDARQTSFVAPDVTNATKLGRILGLAAMIDAADQRRRSQSEDSETAAPDLRDCDHRTLPPAGELSRGSADRDVSGGDFGSAGRGHHRSPLGHAKANMAKLVQLAILPLPLPFASSSDGALSAT